VIGPVYTPTDKRGHGFGSAVTIAAADWAYTAGAKDVVLFTDLANPYPTRSTNVLAFARSLISYESTSPSRCSFRPRCGGAECVWRRGGLGGACMKFGCALVSASSTASLVP
jgi:hypothetical protein